MAINISRCQDETSINTCAACVALQDPNCAWSLHHQRCLHRNADNQHEYDSDINVESKENENSQNTDFETQWVQDIQYGSKNKCPVLELREETIQDVKNISECKIFHSLDYFNITYTTSFRL